MSDIWTRTMQALERKLPSASFADLERAVRCKSASDHEVVLEVPGRIQRDWIHEHYVQLIHDELVSQAGRDVSINIEITPSGRRRTPTTRVPRVQRRPTPAPARPSAPSLAKQPPAGPASAVGARPQAQGAAPATPPRTGSPTPVGEAAGAMGSGLDPRYTFDAFVVGRANEMAHAAAVGVARDPGGLYNPLFLYGGSGLGKTHLLQAIGHEAMASRPGTRVLYRSAEDFMNDFTSSLRGRRMDSFRKYYRERCDLLLIDDVQFMAGKEQTQQEFFHTFEALRQRGAQIVMTSDRLPREIDDLDSRLKSRFTWGLLADIQVPGLETRIAILQKKAEEEGLDLGEDVALFLARHFRHNVRELEGALNRVAAYAGFSGETMDLDFARRVLGPQLPERRSLTIDDVIRTVSDHCKIPVSDIKGKRRQRAIVRARQLAMFLAREVLDSSYPEIGRAFAKDHTTVLAACRKIESLVEDDLEVKTLLEALRRKLVR